MCLSLKRPGNRALRSENLKPHLYYEVNFLVLFLNIVVGVKNQIKNNSNTKSRCFQRGLFDNTKKKENSSSVLLKCSTHRAKLLSITRISYNFHL